MSDQVEQVNPTKANRKPPVSSDKIAVVVMTNGVDHALDVYGEADVARASRAKGLSDSKRLSEDERNALKALEQEYPIKGGPSYERVSSFKVFERAGNIGLSLYFRNDEHQNIPSAGDHFVIHDVTGDTVILKKVKNT